MQKINFLQNQRQISPGIEKRNKTKRNGVKEGIGEGKIRRPRQGTQIKETRRPILRRLRGVRYEKALVLSML